eukprot:6369381-Prymnesium_polylepis.1
MSFSQPGPRLNSLVCSLHPGAGLEPMRCSGGVGSFTSIMAADHDAIPSSVARLCAPVRARSLSKSAHMPRNA